MVSDIGFKDVFRKNDEAIILKDGLRMLNMLILQGFK